MSVHVTSRVWKESSQQGTALLLLLALSDFASDEGVCWPSVASLAERCRLGKRQVQNLLRKLENDGEIELLHLGGGRGHTTSYRVNYASPIRQERVKSGAEKVQSSTKRVQSSTRKGEIAVAPESSLTIKNPPEEPSGAAARNRKLIKAWESSVGPITPGIAEDLFDLADECEAHRQGLPIGAKGRDSPGQLWVVEAIQEARRSIQGGRPNARYVRAIAERWIRDGFKAPMKREDWEPHRESISGAREFLEELRRS